MRCSDCGFEIKDDTGICPKCGASKFKPRKGIFSTNTRLALVFMIIGCVILPLVLVPVGIYICLIGFIKWGVVFFVCALISLCWMIPMTCRYFKLLKSEEEVSVAFIICTMFFVSMISGIFMLIEKESSKEIKIRCSKCGVDLQDDTCICPKCGTPAYIMKEKSLSNYARIAYIVLIIGYAVPAVISILFGMVCAILGMVSLGVEIIVATPITLCWMIPIILYYKKYARWEGAIPIAFIIFIVCCINVIGGIFMILDRGLSWKTKKAQ